MKLGSTETEFRHLRDAGITTCSVVVKGKLYTGTAKCSNSDNFCRDAGRKIALAKALTGTKDVLTKKQRKNVWEGYRHMTHQPRW